jgi:glutathione S-transferase
MTTTTIRLHRSAISGNSHRVELCLSLLGLPFERVEIDLRKGEHKSAAFLAKNRLGQVPVIEDGDLILAESTAVLIYLGLRYDEQARYYPSDALGRAHVQRWLAVASGPLHAGPATLRAATLLRRPVDRQAAEGITKGLFAWLEAELSERPYLVGERATIADVALYTYTAHAPEGGIALEPYPALVAWIARVEALPGFVPMLRTKPPGA